LEIGFDQVGVFMSGSLAACHVYLTVCSTL